MTTRAEPLVDRYRAIIVDIDGTLSNSDHRKHFLEGSKKDWKGFYDEMGHDPINVWCRGLIDAYDLNRRFMHRTCRVDTLLVTGRPSNYMGVTQKWLEYNGIRYERLFMRNEGDFRPDDVVKREIYEQQIKDHYDVLYAIDDRKRVVDMWRGLGLTCLQCAEGNY